MTPELHEKRTQSSGKAVLIAVLLTEIVTEALKVLYVVETGKGDIKIFECIENDGKPAIFGLYCFEHWLRHMLPYANDN